MTHGQSRDPSNLQTTGRLGGRQRPEAASRGTRTKVDVTQLLRAEFDPQALARLDALGLAT